jgi:hypothetical protein
VNAWPSESVAWKSLGSHGLLVGGGVEVGFRGFAEVGADWVLVDVVAAGGEVVGVRDEVVGEASLPDWEFGGEAVGEAAFDQVHGLRDGLVGRGEEQVDVVGHDDKGVEFVGAFGAVVLEGFKEEFGVGGKLEEASAVVGDGGDEEGASLGGSWRDGHGLDCRVVRGC